MPHPLTYYGKAGELGRNPKVNPFAVTHGSWKPRQIPVYKKWSEWDGGFMFLSRFLCERGYVKTTPEVPGLTIIVREFVMTLLF
jgi:hypothetical protein